MKDSTRHEQGTTSDAGPSPSAAAGKRTMVQRRYSGAVQKKDQGSEAGPVTTNDVAATGFSGTPTSLPYLAELERGFGADLGAVQCYSGPDAAAANEAMGSEAYAVGHQIAFKNDSPDKSLVAHEVAHTIQQTASPAVQTKSAAVHNDFEAEADAAAATIASGGQAEVTMRTSDTPVQRWGGSDHLMLGNAGGKKALERIRGKNHGKLPDGLSTKQTDIAHGEQGGGIDKEKGETLAIGTKQQTTEWGLTGPKKVTKEGELTLGGASRIGGDYAKTAQDLESMNNDWYENYGAMVGIASTNSNHFFPLNHSEYWSNHGQAMLLAAAAGKQQDLDKKKELYREAMIFEGFACHFLQDTFAAGHHAPRALDAMSSYWENTNEAKMGLQRTHYWHDFFCMVPNGLPTSQGRFHGDYYMDGHDLEVVSQRTSESVEQVVSLAFGLAPSKAPVLPVPDFSAIMADPVAGPVWKAMIGGGTQDLQGYGADLNESKKRGAGYTTSGGTSVTNKGVLDPMEKNIFGKGQDAEGPAGNKHNVLEAVRGIQHFLHADFGANVHTREDDEGKQKAKGAAKWDVLELEKNFAMYTGLLGIAKKWQSSLKEEDVEDKKTAHWLISRVETWIAEVNKNVVERAWKSEVTQMIQRDVTAAIGKLD